MTVEERIRNEAEMQRRGAEQSREAYLQSDVFQRRNFDSAYAEKLDTVLEFVKDGPGARILDIGCNAGGEATYLQNQGYQVVAGDINETAVEIARERCEQFGHQCPEFLTFDAHHLPFDDGSFDYVVCWEVLHHMADLPTALSEIARVLRPGGRGIAYEPYAYNPYRRFSEIRHVVSTRGKGIEKSFTKGQLRDEFNRANIRLLEVTHHSMGLSEWKAKRYPAYKRAGARVYYALQAFAPGLLAPLLIKFEKPATSTGS